MFILSWHESLKICDHISRWLMVYPSANNAVFDDRTIFSIFFLLLLFLTFLNSLSLSDEMIGDIIGKSNTIPSTIRFLLPHYAELFLRFFFQQFHFYFLHLEFSDSLLFWWGNPRYQKLGTQNSNVLILFGISVPYIFKWSMERTYSNVLLWISFS